ncbi:glutathione S-transferase family protein [Paracoccus zhejiangensis]|uniref:glutathione transferase n=1 Tax=Paracoccus zhejiangensis TaxID=1077935 RepID=A0A2H5F314_9RHOB|nr:glutathione S-transferase family protein [Paracoccus zhejiangensis]AUH65941.1 glutathione S-transferase family protein [Paracoccus zhejiangensis]
MRKPVVLRGYQFSAYTRIVRIAMHEKGISFRTEEIDPFASGISEDYLRRHPFGRVPVLSHGAFDVYETAAITRYIDAAFEGPRLMPLDSASVARVVQVISIVDSYGYYPMVRQVFAHRVFRPAIGDETDEAEIGKGLEASLPVLGALDTLASEGHVLNGRTLTLADCHLAPMMAYFVQAAEGRAALAEYSALHDWWANASERRSTKETDPGLPSA